MKKHNMKILVTLCAVTLFLITGCGNTNNKSQQKSTMTESEARQIALEKAGVETATFTKQEYDSSDAEYEFEFHTEDKAYECDINAIDGSIKSFSVEDKKIANFYLFLSAKKRCSTLWKK